MAACWSSVVLGCFLHLDWILGWILGYCPVMKYVSSLQNPPLVAITKRARELICALCYSCQLLFKASWRKLSVGYIKAQIVCIGGNHSKLTVLKLSVSVRMSLSQTCGKQSERGLASHCESASKLDGSSFPSGRSGAQDQSSRWKGRKGPRSDHTKLPHSSPYLTMQSMQT